jgi:hypothetical protein
MRATCLFLVLLLGLLSISACQGPEGPTGPRGPEGIQGPPGEIGTANVIYSPWTAFTSAWRDTVIDGSTLKYHALEAPGLSQAIIDNGTVLAFMQFSGTVIQLPYTSNAGGTVSTLDFLARVGRIYFCRFTHDNSGSIGVGTAVTFRYILIPGGVSETSLKRAQAINWNGMSYREVCGLFDIPE